MSVSFLDAFSDILYLLISIGGSYFSEAAHQVMGISDFSLFLQFVLILSRSVSDTGQDLPTLS